MKLLFGVTDNEVTFWSNDAHLCKLYALFVQNKYLKSLVTVYWFRLTVLQCISSWYSY